MKGIVASVIVLLGLGVATAQAPHPQAKTLEQRVDELEVQLIEAREEILYAQDQTVQLWGVVAELERKLKDR